MTPPRTILDLAFGGRWFASPLRRLLTFGIAALVLGILCVFPRSYLVSEKLAPPGANTAGLAGAVGGAGINGLGANYDVNYLIAQSYATEQEVAQRLHLLGTPGYETPARASLKLRKIVEVRPLRGAMFDVRAVTHDPDLSLRLATTYADVFRARVSQLGRQQTAYKRRFLSARMADATTRLKAAQAALDQYRERNHLPAPEAQLGSAVGQLAGLQAAIQAKRVELQSALRFATPESLEVKGIQAQLESLQGQAREFQEQDRSQGDLTPSGIARRSNEYINLQQEVVFTQMLYQSYEKLIEGLTLEEMTNDFNLLPIEAPYVEPSVYIHAPAAGLLVLVILAAIICELYLASPTASVRRLQAAREARP